MMLLYSDSVRSVARFARTHLQNVNKPWWWRRCSVDAPNCFQGDLGADVPCLWPIVTFQSLTEITPATISRCPRPR